MSLWKSTTTAMVILSAAMAHAQDLESILNATGPTDPATKTYSTLQHVLLSKIPHPSLEQSQVIQSVETGDWQKALLQYSQAFDGTAFQNSEDGRALFALIHFKAGMPVTGLEMLFKVEQPGKIHSEVRRLWKEAAPEKAMAWDLAKVVWKPEFSEIFGPEAEFKILTRDSSMLKNPDDLLKLFAKLPNKSGERARAGWQLVIAYSLQDKVEEAAKVLAHLMKTEPAPVSQPLMDLTAARLLYQRGMYGPAIKYYEKIPKRSEYWTDAQEEMAWSYLRKGEPQNAMAITKSLVSPAMVIQSGAESFLVYSMAQLRVCDYSGVSSSLKDFVKTFKERNAALEEIATSDEIWQIHKAIDIMKTKRMTREDLGREAKTLPRLIARDERLFQLAQAQKYLEDEARAADLIYAKSQSQKIQSDYFDNLRQSTLAQAHAATRASTSRARELAKLESNEIKEILRKLHIVEAEVIQQVALANAGAPKSSSSQAEEKKGTTGAMARDVLRFPADNEVWFDEIGNYRISLKKACQTRNKTKS